MIFNGLIRFITNLFNRCNHLYYMNQTVTLPPPLSEHLEKEALINVQNGSIDARNDLIIHNMRLVIFIAKKFESSRIPLDDLISIGTLGLIKGISTFKIEKNIKLATYASRCIENEILMYLRKTQKSRNDISLDEVLTIDGDGNEMVLGDILADKDESQLGKLIDEEKQNDVINTLNRLKPREKDIIIKRFGLFGQPELTQKEVALELGISQSYISRLEKRILKKMKMAIINKNN